MKPFIHQLVLLILSSLAVYTLLLALTLIAMPPQPSSQNLDTSRASATLFSTEPKYVFLGRGALDNTRDKVFLLGASNVVVGFNRGRMQEFLPDADIHNVSVGGSNITQLRQIVDLVHEVQSDTAKRHNLFVIGLWYGLFADDRQRWNSAGREAGDTDIDIERYRYGFFKRSASGPVALLPPQWLQAGVYLIHPYLVLDKAMREGKKVATRMFKGSPGSADSQDIAAIDEAEKRRYLTFWDDYMGRGKNISADQIAALTALIDDIVAAGGRVTLVDLPLPPWHASRSPYHAAYQQQIQGLLQALDKRPQVSVAHLNQNALDSDFSDEVHPLPLVARKWEDALVAALKNRGGAGQLASRNSYAQATALVSVVRH